MTDLNLNTLPTREDLKRAIDHLWRGGGTATLIVDVCREQQATTREAVVLAERLADRASNGLHHISREIVQETLEMVRAVAGRASSKKELQEPEFDPSLCVFGDGVGCWNCGEIHGEALPTEQAAELIGAARRKVTDYRPAEVADSLWEEKVLALRRLSRMDGVCDGVGKGWIVHDGKEVCPDCGEPRQDRVYEGGNYAMRKPWSRR